MPRSLKRWYVWLALFLLLGLTASAALIYSNRSRITQGNFDRIQDGMTIEEVEAILGPPDPEYVGPIAGRFWPGSFWNSGPNWISVSFAGGRADGKSIHLASMLETLEWYAKDGLKRIGVSPLPDNPFDHVMDAPARSLFNNSSTAK